MLTSVAHSKFVFIEFSPELINVIKLYENINVGQTEYKLKGIWCDHVINILLVQFSFKENGPILMTFVPGVKSLQLLNGR